VTGRGAWLLGSGVLAVLLALPAVVGSYALTVFIFIFFYAYLGQAWNILSGYGGQLSAGHAAFVGVGAYTTTMLAMTLGVSPWIGMFAGGALAAVLGGLIGFLGFRFGLRGFYFVLLTVAFAEVCRVIALNTDAIGGALGLYITFTGDPWQFQFRDNRAYYYVALGFMLAATGIVLGLERSRVGAYLVAIREDEDAAEALGVATFRYKLLAMALSAFLAGLGGAFYANYLFSLQPNAVFGIPFSVDIIIRSVVGGSGTAWGPVLGSFILSPLAELSRVYVGHGGRSGLHLVVYGVLLIAVVLCLPRGAYPPLARALARRRSRG
jgi:branched-chain amino acid transport system permease protein